MSRQHIHIPTNIADKASDTVTSFFGSWLCLGLHILWFVAWLVLRLDINTLTMIVSLEAIFLSTLVMMSQNRQGTKDRTRDDLESHEVQSMFDNHLLLMKINQQQLEILTLLQEQNKSRRSKAT